MAGSEPPSAAPTRPTRTARIAAAAVGLLLGVSVVFALPGSWLFVEPAPAAASHAAAHAKTQYACPMFCVIMDHLPESGKCPVCGMTLTRVSSESTLNAQERRMIGLEVEPVRRIPLARTLRVVGEVDYDETRLFRITTRTAGWLETVWVDTTWAEVQRNEPLAAIYSPELYQAEQEYLVAWRAARNDSSDRGAARTGDLLHTARRRLELLGVGPREIEDLGASGHPRDSVVLRSPIHGVVVERRAVEGSSVEKGATLYTVADLDRVWIQALVFEADLPWVRTGQSVRLEIEGRTEPMVGEVAFVDPAIDRLARTARVRIEVDNAPSEGGVRPLRIGQRVDAWIEARLDDRGMLVPPGQSPRRDPLAVPRSAVLRTGERELIYVLYTERDTPDGRERDYALDPEALPDPLYYEPVQIRTGPLSRRLGDFGLVEYYPILAVVPPPPQTDPETGESVPVLSLRRITEGVAVVTHGNLLLDSQAQLAGRPSLLFPAGNRGAPADPHAGH